LKRRPGFRRDREREQAVKPRFSIITTSKGRLEHLKRSLPAMLAQPDCEIVVVDYSCPEGTADFVRAEFPEAVIVTVEGEKYFSNWKARNAGAAVATGDILIFCDADIVLADGAVDWIAKNLPRKAFAHSGQFGANHDQARASPLATNQLKGFQAIPATAFRKLGGYDEMLEGYAAGGDTDLHDRLRAAGLKPFALDPATIVGQILEHSDEARFTHHRDPLAVSYAAALLYRAAKLYLQRLANQPDLPVETRRKLYDVARTTAQQLKPPNNGLAMTVDVDDRAISMPLQLGFRKGRRKVSFKVEISMEGPVEP
jgi:glycosyltransferase involved in cell wall biosynthesis